MEIYLDGQWGYICGDGWNEAAAQAVCRHLSMKGIVIIWVKLDHVESLHSEVPSKALASPYLFGFIENCCPTHDIQLR